MAVFTSEKLLPCNPSKNPSRPHLPNTFPLRLFLSPPLHRHSRLRFSRSNSSLLEEASEEISLNLQPSAFERYQKARSHPDYKPDKETLRLLSRFLLKCRLWDSISLLTEDFRLMDVYPDSATCSRLVNGCIKARKFKLAHSLLGAFQHEPTISAAAFGAAMRAFNKLHMYSTTIQLHIPADVDCFSHAMDAHRKLGNVDQVLAIFFRFKSLQIPATSTVSLSRIYFILCDSLGSSGRPFEALRFFREMTANEGISPDSSSYCSLICSFAGIKEAEIAEDLFQEAKEKKLATDPAVFLKMVLMYVELGSLQKTMEIVRAMKELNLGVSDCVFCAVVNGHAKKLSPRAAVLAYEQLISMGCKPGQVSYASAISIYSRLGLLPMAEALFQEMVDRGFDRCLVAYSTMISAYGKSGRVREAMKLLAKMKEKGCEPNVWVYNSLIDMHGKASDLRKVEKLWKEMRRRRVAPDRVSYTAMIGAYGKARELDECVRLYEEFRMSGEKVDRAVAGIMVGVFAKSGRIDELVKLLQDVQEQGLSLDDRLYASALNALRDAGLEMQIRWLRKNFPQVKAKKQS